MLTRSSQYALRAVIYLARNSDDWPIPGRVIAEQSGIPRKYLSKILGDLVRTGVLRSSRGKTGGFSMRKKPNKTRLIEVLTPFEPFETRTCPFGNQTCSDANPCLAHSRWKEVVQAEQAFLQTTSIHEVSHRQPSRG